MTERFDESVPVLREALGWNRVVVAAQNVSEERLRREDAAPAVVERLQELNRHDAELHRFAGDLLD